MGQDITIDVVRLAMGLEELKAHLASVNIANASRPDARALRMDFAATQSALAAAGVNDGSFLQQASAALRTQDPIVTDALIRTDEQIGEMTTAGLKYQALTEALSRHFGLMRLAITGRS